MLTTPPFSPFLTLPSRQFFVCMHVLRPALVSGSTWVNARACGSDPGVNLTASTSSCLLWVHGSGRVPGFPCFPSRLTAKLLISIGGWPTESYTQPRGSRLSAISFRFPVFVGTLLSLQNICFSRVLWPRPSSLVSARLVLPWTSVESS